MCPFYCCILSRLKYHHKFIPCNQYIIPPVVLIISPKSPIRVINNKVGNILIPISNKPRQRYNMVRVPVFKPELPGKGKTATLNQVSYYRINRHPGRKPVYFSFFLLSRVFTPHFSIW